MSKIDGRVQIPLWIRIQLKNKHRNSTQMSSKRSTFLLSSPVRLVQVGEVGPHGQHTLHLRQVQLVIVQDSCHGAHSNSSAERNGISKKQCCGSGIFIPDPSFFHPGSRIKIFPSQIPQIRIKELKYFNPKYCCF